jgi:hypothetical protein
VQVQSVSWKKIFAIFFSRQTVKTSRSISHKTFWQSKTKDMIQFWENESTIIRWGGEMKPKQTGQILANLRMSKCQGKRGPKFVQLGRLDHCWADDNGSLEGRVVVWQEGTRRLTGHRGSLDFGGGANHFADCKANGGQLSAGLI